MIEQRRDEKEKSGRDADEGLKDWNWKASTPGLDTWGISLFRSHFQHLFSLANATSQHLSVSLVSHRA